jgi:hypothetical protein
MTLLVWNFTFLKLLETLIALILHLQQILLLLIHHPIDVVSTVILEEFIKDPHQTIYLHYFEPLAQLMIPQHILNAQINYPDLLLEATLLHDVHVVLPLNLLLFRIKLQVISLPLNLKWHFHLRCTPFQGSQSTNYALT